MKACQELKAARWLSTSLEELTDGMEEVGESLGSEDLPDSPLMKNLGQGLVDVLRMRISAYSNQAFRVQRAAEWKMLEQTTPAGRPRARGWRWQQIEGRRAAQEEAQAVEVIQAIYQDQDGDEADEVHSAVREAMQEA